VEVAKEKKKRAQKNLAAYLRHSQITVPLHIYKNVIMPLKIIKMPLWAVNVGPMMWTG